MTASPVPLGELLLAAGLITAEQLGEAVETQSREGGLIGRHLILMGAVTRREMYAELARQWGAPLLDLTAEPPDPALLHRLGKELILQESWLPWRRDGDTLVVATSVTPTPELSEEAARRFGATRVEFRTTTDWDVSQTVQAAFRAGLLYDSAERLAAEDQLRSAKTGLRWWQRAVPVLLVTAVPAGLVLETNGTISVLFAFANLVFLVNVGFKVLAGARTPLDRRRARRWHDWVVKERAARGLGERWPELTPDDDLPIYTILVPVFREANVIEKVLANIGSLDYPHAKLDVLVLLEEDDTRTIEMVKKIKPPEYVRLLVVPRGQPQTKPRACNYGLTFARGEYVVIYDAEDRPEPDQLRQAVTAFELDDFEREHIDPQRRRLVCVQAALNYFNADYNVLTRMFAVEYAHWFDSMLPGMDAMNIPIPLGGTSNHFRTAPLIEMGAWDPYNVTEDADLGLRVSAYGYRIGVIDSTTWEEATSRVSAWVRQRTRWIKGYMVTAAVNTRHPISWLRQNGAKGAATLIGLVAGTPLAFMFYPLVLGFTAITYIGAQFIGLEIPSWLLEVGVANMVVSNGLMIVLSGIAAWRRYNWRIGVFAVLNPVYWLLHAAAAWRAAYQVAVDPHRWEKTPHGLSEEYDDSSVSAPAFQQ